MMLLFSAISRLSWSLLATEKHAPDQSYRAEEGKIGQQDEKQQRLHHEQHRSQCLYSSCHPLRYLWNQIQEEQPTRDGRKTLPHALQIRRTQGNLRCHAKDEIHEQRKQRRSPPPWGENRLQHPDCPIPHPLAMHPDTFPRSRCQRHECRQELLSREQVRRKHNHGASEPHRARRDEKLPDLPQQPRLRLMRNISQSVSSRTERHEFENLRSRQQASQRMPRLVAHHSRRYQPIICPPQQSAPIPSQPLADEPQHHRQYKHHAEQFPAICKRSSCRSPQMSCHIAHPLRPPLPPLVVPLSLQVFHLSILLA